MLAGLIGGGINTNMAADASSRRIVPEGSPQAIDCEASESGKTSRK
ncbi:hypothetical protein [Verminephrobacter eiseniae]|nr:hypothetical protein [Verminephrobacter eiseniae]